VLTHGDTIRLGQAGDTEIVFFVDDEAPSVERSAISAATELRQMARCSKGCARSDRAACSTTCWRWCSTRRSR
jgi:hypothetical protein